MAGLPTHIIGDHEANSKTVALYEPARREHLTKRDFLSLSWSKFELAMEHLRKENAWGRKEMGISQFAQKKAGRMSQQEFTSALFYGAAALPRAHKAARGEGRNVCRVGQFLVGHVQLDATRNSFPHGPKQSVQYPCQSLFRGVTRERDVRGNVPG